MATRQPAIIDLEDFTESINGCIYSDSGIGKTVFAGTDNVLFLGIEQGTISAKRMGSKGKLWKIKTWNDLADAHDWLEANPDHGFSWIVIDSVTEMQKLCMRGILNLAHSENKKRDLDIPALADWQKYYNMFDRFVSEFNDLPVNVLWLATQMQNEDPEGEEIVLPTLYGRGQGYSVSQGFCASLGFVGNLQKEIMGKGDDVKTVRRILFENMPPFFAKDRYNVLPRWVTVSDGDTQKTTLKAIREAIEKSENRVPPAARPVKKAVPAARRRVPAKR